MEGRRDRLDSPKKHEGVLPDIGRRIRRIIAHFRRTRVRLVVAIGPEETQQDYCEDSIQILVEDAQVRD